MALPISAEGRKWGGGPLKAGRRGSSFYFTFAQTCVLHSGQTKHPFTTSSTGERSETVAA